MTKLKPVKQPIKPEYPTKTDVLSDPYLLRLLPERWRHGGRIVVTAGVLTAVMLAVSTSQKVTADDSFTKIMGKTALNHFISESDVINLIQDQIGRRLPTLQRSFNAADSTKPITYLYYDINNDTFKEVTLLIDGDFIEIDAFDAQKSIGFEYITVGGMDATGYQQTGKLISEADADSAYVLVIQPQTEDMNGFVMNDIQSFISWLRSEHIL